MRSLRKPAKRYWKRLTKTTGSRESLRILRTGTTTGSALTLVHRMFLTRTALRSAASVSTIVTRTTITVIGVNKISLAALRIAAPVLHRQIHSQHRQHRKFCKEKSTSPARPKAPLYLPWSDVVKSKMGATAARRPLYTVVLYLGPHECHRWPVEEWWNLRGLSSLQLR